MRKLLPLIAALLLGSNAMAQSAEFKELEEQILEYFDSQQYQEVLALAPKLLEAEPWRPIPNFEGPLICCGRAFPREKSRTRNWLPLRSF